MIKNSALATNLFNLRTKKELSQQQIAVILNISQQAYSKYEKGLTEPDTKTLLKLSDLYEISIDEILGNEKFITEIDSRAITIPTEKKETVQQLLALPEKLFIYISGEIKAYYQASQLQ